jgi:ssDNA-binding Zn-finger/Zn-ribbon topoisomerase 1
MPGFAESEEARRERALRGDEGCDDCAHPQRLHDERIRAHGNGRCPACWVCAAETEAGGVATPRSYRCPKCRKPGMVLPFGAHAALSMTGALLMTWQHDEWSDGNDAECSRCGFSGTVANFAVEGR